MEESLYIWVYGPLSFGEVRTFFIEKGLKVQDSSIKKHEQRREKIEKVRGQRWVTKDGRKEEFEKVMVERVDARRNGAVARKSYGTSMLSE